jgi:hypothetical protein
MVVRRSTRLQISSCMQRARRTRGTWFASKMTKYSVQCESFEYSQSYCGVVTQVQVPRFLAIYLLGIWPASSVLPQCGYN